MDALTLYTLSTSGYLTLQSTPLLLTPRLITSLLTTTTTSTPQCTTDLETYLSRTLALTLLTLAALNLILTGVLPSTTSLSTKDDENGVGTGLKNPYAYPTVTITTTYHALSAFYLYTNIASPRGGLTFGFGAGLTLSAGLFCLGLWVLLFGGEKGRVSKTTGADKRTGNFPFENKESSREKKKESSGKRKSVSSKLR
ncbi:hypothetical protein M409DRAFT_17194 [Zasmidium cellare ATCC 36951]|uniref:Uncharacterized protein n=1 Tax=Zasmidium cellare ATCC 36951 TaxID=1080233 RepID=A0A6A6D4G2_ZASCE|nr:uncharacterized protein M409DRAFT_17194 [Zasmidium cellare ATCC 36951]KAF2173250.1 hypothetical protein M409DRAFT_17194 [Zasmidium cellare ATCC 36951]